MSRLHVPKLGGGCVRRKPKHKHGVIIADLPVCEFCHPCLVMGANLPGLPSFAKHVGWETGTQEFPAFRAEIPAYSRLRAAGASTGRHISAQIPGRKPGEPPPLSTVIPAHAHPDLGFLAARRCLRKTLVNHTTHHKCMLCTPLKRAKSQLSNYIVYVRKYDCFDM